MKKSKSFGEVTSNEIKYNRMLVLLDIKKKIMWRDIIDYIFQLSYLNPEAMFGIGEECMKINILFSF